MSEHGQQMNYSKRFQHAISTTQQPTGIYRRSQLKLLQEFLRRELLWAKELNIKAERSAYEFYALPLAILPSAQYPKELFLTVKGLPLSEPEQTCAINAARWYWLQDNYAQHIALHDLPDPYEPLLWFFERGGRFTIEHGILDVPRVGGVKYDTFVRRLESEALDKPVVRLDSQALDQIDAVP